MLHEKRISLVVAMDVNGLIGKGNTLPWPMIAEDMQWFKNNTLGQSVLYGRKTWDSLPEKFRPLPGRENIIMSHQSDFQAPGALVAHSFEEAVMCATKEKVCVIGGAEIYRLALPFADELIISHIGLPFKGDTWFPDYNKSEWCCLGDPLLGMSYLPCTTKSGIEISVCFAVYGRIAAP